MTWKGEKTRHSMAARGLKTIDSVKRPKDIVDFLLRLRNITDIETHMMDVSNGWEYLDVIRSITNVGDEYIVIEDNGYDLVEVDLWRKPDVHHEYGDEQHAIWYGPGGKDSEWATEVYFDNYNGWSVSEYTYNPHNNKYAKQTRVINEVITYSPCAAVSTGVERLAWWGGEMEWVDKLPRGDD